MQEPPYTPAADITAVNACVREIRQDPEHARFEAHIGPRGDLRSNGTEQELRAFKQCMQAKGSPLDSNYVMGPGEPRWVDDQRRELSARP